MLFRSVSRLLSSTEEMDAFLRLPRINEGAEDVIWEMIVALDSAIDSLLKA